jgi:hypothetical protein
MFLNDWARDNYSGKTGLEAMREDFNIDEAALKGVSVLLAAYGYESYSGDAFVLFRKAGKLYEVNGGHCSCYGLEGQWQPQEVTKAELIHRLDKGRLGNYSDNKYADELRAVLKKIRVRKS